MKSLKQPLATGLYSLSSALFAFNVLLATVFPRFAVITNNNFFAQLSSSSQIWGCFIASLFLIITQLRLFVSIVLFFIVLIIDAYTRFFWPSLASTIPWQDYLFKGGISANHSFHVAFSTLQMIFLYLSPALALLAGKSFMTRQLVWFFIVTCVFSLFTNFAVTFYQHSVDLNFLATGSGTAIAAGRAVGLLEDSAAAGLYFSFLSLTSFGLLLFGAQNRNVRLCFLLSFVASFLGGSFTRGRVFFLIFFVGSFILTSIRFLPKAHKKKGTSLKQGIFLSALLLLSVFLFWSIAPSRSFRILEISRYPRIFGAETFFHKALVLIDPDRAVHIKAMAKAFWDAPILGHGLGSFYIILHRYKEWALSTGGTFFADPPGNFYLDLLAELGLLGVFLIFLSFKSYIRLGKALRVGINTHPDSLTYGFTIITFSVSTALIISFLCGTHLIFHSFACFFAIACAALFPLGERSTQKGYGNYIFYALTGLFLLTSSYRFIFPIAPERFDLENNHSPQVPLSLIIPIKPPKDGLWVAQNAPFILAYPSIEIFLETPKEYYPLSAAIEVFDQKKKLLEKQTVTIDEYNPLKPGEIFHIQFAENTQKTCLSQITRQYYCTFRINSSPLWIYNRQPVAGFIPKEYLRYKKL